MRKTFYSIELILWEVTADVDHRNISVDNGKSTKRVQLMSVFTGNAGTLTEAEAKYRKADGVIND